HKKRYKTATKALQKTAFFSFQGLQRTKCTPNIHRFLQLLQTIKKYAETGILEKTTVEIGKIL
ncbi:MAG: hypothetical protein IIV88_05155, partial [Erysipelotrichaceae bacterium]|nr:hypothetical protein [Erysipelotrichaceae bacterium]